MERQAPRFSQGGSPARSRSRAAPAASVLVVEPVRELEEEEEEEESEGNQGDAFWDDGSSDSSDDVIEVEEEIQKLSEDDLLSGTTTFKTGKGLADALRQYAVTHGFKITSTSRGGSSKKYCCSFAPGCIAFFNVRKLHAGDWHVSDAHLEHTNCTAFSNPSAQNISKLKLFISLIEGNRGASAKDMGALVQVRTCCIAPVCVVFLNSPTRVSMLLALDDPG